MGGAAHQVGRVNSRVNIVKQSSDTAIAGSSCVGETFSRRFALITFILNRKSALKNWGEMESFRA